MSKGKWIVPLPDGTTREMPFDEYLKLSEEEKQTFNGWVGNKETKKEEPIGIPTSSLEEFFK